MENELIKSRVQVQQQEGVDYCGLFACAYLELLSEARDPACYKFNQMRKIFDNFLRFDSFEGFEAEENGTVPTLKQILIDWKVTWEERCAEMRDAIRQKRDQKQVEAIHETID